MSNHSTRPIILFGIGCSAVWCASVSAPCAKAQTPAPAAAPSGVIVIDEDVWSRLAEEPSHHLQKAGAAADQGKPAEAAHELEKASAFMFAAAGHLGYRHKSALYDSAKQLELLANQLRDGSPKADGMLPKAFARAHLALAAYHLAQADHVLKSYDEPSLVKRADRGNRAERYCSTAGRYLQAAASSLEGSTKWRGEGINEKTGTTAGQIRKLAQELTACAVPIDEAAARLKQMDEQIDVLARRQEAPQAAAKSEHENRR
ncbi:MAG TPA: hypothetical protein VFW87_08240 [Pirellulales bacterium]|nr:hypothetical protein [Pirellulales bacterium]